MIYLDHAATSLPKPPEVVEAVVAAMSNAGNPSRGGHRYAAEAGRLIARARITLATLLGAEDPRRIVFCLNGTDALNIAIHAALEPFIAGGFLPHVVTTTLEHNSVTRPLQALADRGAIDLDRVAPLAAPGSESEGVIEPESIRQALRRDTRLVVVTHASNALGTLQPIAEIIKQVRGACDALIVVDAAQTVGAMPFRLSDFGADFVAAPGHKALFGPTGTGILYVGPRAMPDLDGTDARIGVFRSGGTGGDSRLMTMPPELPHRLEGGTPNVSGIAGLGAGAAWVASRGIEAIQAHERRMIEQAISGLERVSAVVGGRSRIRVIGPRDAARRIAALSFTIEGLDPLDAATMLDAGYGIALRAGLHCAPGAHESVGTSPAGTLRLSVGPSTTAAEIDACVGAVGEILR